MVGYFLLPVYEKVINFYGSLLRPVETELPRLVFLSFFPLK